jgi:hypothetical protein
MLGTNLISVFDAGASHAAAQAAVSATQIAVAIFVSVVLLVFAWFTTIKGKDPKKDTGLFVGYIAYFAIICGACFIAIATKNWPSIFLIAGGCLGAGFVFGLLFGYPLSDGKKKSAGPGNGAAADRAGAGQAGARPAAASNQSAPTGRNLMQQSADSLSKVIAGATLVQYQKIAVEFRAVSWSISRCAGDCCANSDKAFGAGVTLYFFTLGFLIGLFLLPLYNLEPGDHSGAPGGPGDGGADNGGGNLAGGQQA